MKSSTFFLQVLLCCAGVLLRSIDSAGCKDCAERETYGACKEWVLSCEPTNNCTKEDIVSCKFGFDVAAQFLNDTRHCDDMVHLECKIARGILEGAAEHISSNNQQSLFDVAKGLCSIGLKPGNLDTTLFGPCAKFLKNFQRGAIKTQMTDLIDKLCTTPEQYFTCEAIVLHLSRDPMTSPFLTKRCEQLETTDCAINQMIMALEGPEYYSSKTVHKFCTSKNSRYCTSFADKIINKANITAEFMEELCNRTMDRGTVLERTCDQFIQETAVENHEVLNKVFNSCSLRGHLCPKYVHRCPTCNVTLAFQNAAAVIETPKNITFATLENYCLLNSSRFCNEIIEITLNKGHVTGEFAYDVCESALKGKCEAFAKKIQAPYYGAFERACTNATYEKATLCTVIVEKCSNTYQQSDCDNVLRMVDTFRPRPDVCHTYDQLCMDAFDFHCKSPNKTNELCAMTFDSLHSVDGHKDLLLKWFKEECVLVPKTLRCGQIVETFLKHKMFGMEAATIHCDWERQNEMHKVLCKYIKFFMSPKSYTRKREVPEDAEIVIYRRKYALWVKYAFILMLGSLLVMVHAVYVDSPEEMEDHEDYLYDVTEAQNVGIEFNDDEVWMIQYEAPELWHWFVGPIAFLCGGFALLWFILIKNAQLPPP